MNIETIAQFKPKNDANFPIVDTLDIKGGYLPFQTLVERNNWTSKYTSRLTVGLLCHVTANGYYYEWKGTKWLEAEMGSGGSAGNVIILDTAPLDVEGNQRENAVWIDTSGNGLREEDSVVSSLLRMINVLAAKVSKLEYMNQLISSGEFSNNMYDLYGNITGIDPETDIYTTVDEDEAETTTQLWDDDNEELLNNTLLADSSEPTEYKDLLPNVKHIQVKWGKYTDMLTYKDNFMPAELLWCYDKKQLWIKDPKTYKLIQIGTASSGTNTEDDSETIEDIMNGIIQSGDYIGSISFVDMIDSTKHYTFGVKGGELDLYDESLDTTTKANAQTILSEGATTYSTPYLPISASNSSSTNPLIFINQVYSTGATDDTLYKDYSLCNYEFIELANLTLEDLNLNGLFLHYTERGELTAGRTWITLPLKGVIKSGSTFLIRCAKCGQDKYAKIKVGKPDMYWTKDLTLNPDALKVSGDTYSMWDNDNMLKIQANCSLLLTGPLYEGTTVTTGTTTTTLTAQEVTTATLKTTPYVNATPWLNNSGTISVCYGFIDLVGFGAYNSKDMPNISSKCTALSNDKLYVHYYDLDNVSQAYKSVVTTDNANNKTFNYINLDNTNPEINLDWYLPKNSTEGKTIFYNKHLLEAGAPNFITCTFGFNPHTTRCFTWVSKGYRDEFLRYRKKGETTWTTVESFKEGDGRSTAYNRGDSIYNRIRSFTTDGTYFSVHKLIIDLYEPFVDNKLADGPTDTETYEYQAGYDDYWTDIKEFTLRNRQKVINDGFKFVQVTDQQGFNAEEYKTWEVSADYIYKNESDIEFGINTGDATQNGNRINEWVDYFNASKPLFDHMEQQYTVGNNDLCPYTPYELGLGDDTTKVNPINVQYFFTYEHPNEIPKSSAGIYVPSVYSYVYGNTYFLSMNSEITTSTTPVLDEESGTYKTADVVLFGESGKNLYTTEIKNWCDNDLTYITSLGVTPDWKIAYCHENPFTLLIKSVITSYSTAKKNYEDSPEGSTTSGTGDNATTKSNKTIFEALLKHRGTVTSHLNSVGNFWFSKFLEDNKFNLSLCGHKHTFTSSYYLRDNEEDRMQPYIYNPGTITLSSDEAKVAQLSTDTSKWYVKYTMCQATGYKTISNKELPANNIGWLESYYPSDSDKNNSNVNLQRYPHYIVWSIGKGKETETPGTDVTEDRERILGKVKKLWYNKMASVTAAKNTPFNYNTRLYTSTNLSEVNGNGLNGNKDILVIKGLFGIDSSEETPKETSDTTTETTDMTNTDDEQAVLLTENN